MKQSIIKLKLNENLENNYKNVNQDEKYVQKQNAHKVIKWVYLQCVTFPISILTTNRHSTRIQQFVHTFMGSRMSYLE